MPHPILYCGDTELSSAASYLAGLITRAGWEFDYIPSHVPLTDAYLAIPRQLYIFSDFPAAHVSPAVHERIAGYVRGGAGLLMIGGWESFHGLGGDWEGTPIAEALGVAISASDDRVNSFSPAMLVPERDASTHPILAGLPWNEFPPFVGGWNAIGAGSATSLLTIRQFAEFRLQDDGTLLGTAAHAFPGLTIHTYGAGRTATFLSDVAPHWVGGFVDWGDTRVQAQAPGAPAIEVGNWYAQFWQQLLQWTGAL